MNGAGTNGSSMHPRVEVVTATFVAAGIPAGIRDVGRLLENLNNPALSRQIELRDATLRPLYRAASPLAVEAPVLVRREDIVFATFEAPTGDQDESAQWGGYDAGHERPGTTQSPCLLLAPPFQIQGGIALSGTEAQQSLRTMLAGFVSIVDARVYDADGYLLGEGERIVVNGARVQMSALTKRHIEAFAERAGSERRAEMRQTAAAPAGQVEADEDELVQARAA